MIIIGYPGIGKTSIAGKEGCVDLESSNFFVNGERVKDWQVPYCKVAIDLHKQGYTVFVSSHGDVVNELLINAIAGTINWGDVHVVLPGFGLYSEWVSRLRDRYDRDCSEKNERALRRVEDFYYPDIEKLLTGPFDTCVMNDINYDLLDVVRALKEEE